MWVPTEAAEMEEFLASDGKLNNQGIRYFMMANDVVHELNPAAMTIAEEFTSFPYACESTKKGGL
eukprot:CAMPEP_0170324566 /NCGR_PEP_ID=MMETSP0116_2-20130129/63124_1 /TAXON_ID=400756 /ORGANISM="Durinskia baltica, Strain CSIRO CS-38" /LENGTH=64 /DNA_ID=CAMNT_0010577551 /DNA_START=11 /DNA_END=202 /DNA_ORIENTATION=-